VSFYISKGTILQHMHHGYVYTIVSDKTYIARLMGSLHRKAQLSEGA
jgi:hypothetical protein